MQQEPEEFRVESLYGMEVPPEDVVLRGMADLEEELQGRLDRRQERAASEYLERARDPLLGIIGREEGVREAVSGLSEADARLKEQEPPAPDIQPEAQRIFTGSVGATVGVPYNYDWTWKASSGAAPGLFGASADRNTGTMGFALSGDAGSCDARAAAAVGIFFRPMTANGILRFSSNPAFNYLWWTYCVWGAAHSDAYIGLYVARYTLAGGFDGAPVSQQIWLWNRDSGWLDSVDDEGSNSGFPLFAQLNVDSNHWYALWVWCGGRIFAEGAQGFWGSWAGSSLGVTVPSMTWELF